MGHVLCAKRSKDLIPDFFLKISLNHFHTKNHNLFTRESFEIKIDNGKCPERFNIVF